MIEIEQAIEQIASASRCLRTLRCRTIDALGRILAEDVTADVDSPPHDKSLVDGFAIRVEDAGGKLQLLEQVVAGAAPSKPITSGTTSQIMTGAPIPDGAEAMVMVEDVQQDGETVLTPDDVKLGQAIMPRAKTFAQGDVVLKQGTMIRAIEVGLLSEVGRSEVSVFQKPTVGVLPTGDELVPADQKPSAGQIRNSNGPMLESRVRAAGCNVVSLGVGGDNEADLRQKIETGLQCDILILSGGVSAGVRDLVPESLAAQGVVEVFHKVRLKPGKPVWFGMLDTRDDLGEESRVLVFGLPGNPISSLVCFELFVQTAIRVMQGLDPATERLPVCLASDYELRGNRPTFYPATTLLRDGQTFVSPLDWQGSADMLTVSKANCLVFFDASKKLYKSGEKLEALPLR